MNAELEEIYIDWDGFVHYSNPGVNCARSILRKPIERKPYRVLTKAWMGPMEHGCRPKDIRVINNETGKEYSQCIQYADSSHGVFLGHEYRSGKHSPKEPNKIQLYENEDFTIYHLEKEYPEKYELKFNHVSGTAKYPKKATFYSNDFDLCDDVRKYTYSEDFEIEDLDLFKITKSGKEQIFIL